MLCRMIEKIETLFGTPRIALAVCALFAPFSSSAYLSEIQRRSRCYHRDSTEEICLTF
jgi:hypothetical protein